MKVRILRYKPGRIDPPRFETFDLPVADTLTVLDALELIRLTRDSGLMYRHSCHHSACGTCAMRINGEERLACITRLGDLSADTVTLEPLEGFTPIADLVVDMNALHAHIDPRWSCLRPSDTPAAKAAAKEGGHPAMRLEDCIECGGCISACPVASQGDPFMGPAALAALSNQLAKTPEAGSALMTLAGAPNGEPACRRALACSRVCPTGVSPARHIARLRRNREKTDKPE